MAYRAHLIIALTLLGAGAARAAPEPGELCILKDRLALTSNPDGKGKATDLRKGSPLKIVSKEGESFKVQSGRADGFATAADLMRVCNFLAKKPAEAPAPVDPPAPPPAPPPTSEAAAPTPPAPPPVVPAETVVAAPSVPAAPVATTAAPVIIVQDPTPQERETLLSAPFVLGYSGGLALRATQALDGSAFMVGLRGGFASSAGVHLGLAGFMTLVPPSFEASAYRNERFVQFGYGGMEVGYELSPKKLVHLGARGLFGLGGAGHRSAYSGDTYVGTDFFGVAEPGLEVVINAHSFMRVALGAGYRLTYGVGLPGVERLDGVNFDLSISGGLF